MARSRKDKPKEPNYLGLTEAFLEQFVECEIEEDLHRVGAVWAGFLGLERPITAPTVAAMMSAYDLVLATALVDSENHWARAAAFAVLGNKSETKELEEHDQIEDKKIESLSDFKIGFRPSTQG